MVSGWFHGVGRGVCGVVCGGWGVGGVWGGGGGGVGGGGGGEGGGGGGGGGGCRNGIGVCMRFTCGGRIFVMGNRVYFCWRAAINFG